MKCLSVKQLFKPVPPDRLVRFWYLWKEAQKLRDVPRMEELLTGRWLRFWWGLRSETQNDSDVESAIQIILQKEKVIPVPPERPSERAMRLASANRPAIQSRRKPLPLP